MGATTALYLRGMSLNVSAGAGFGTLFAIAILDGILMVMAVDRLRHQGLSLDEAILQGRLRRFRPILMTTFVAIVGLIPASLATGLGSDVQRPLATVIIWGLSSSTLLAHFISPVFFSILAPPMSEVSADELADLPLVAVANHTRST
jgi:cobalt-zinc-cadmium resistance protein CzcA